MNNGANEGLNKALKKIEKFEWKYKNLILLVVSLVGAYFILQSEFLHSFLTKAGDFGYIGSFVAGILFTNTLTVAPATAVIFLLSETSHPVFIALFGSLGALLSDYVIFRFVRERLLGELKSVSKELRVSGMWRIGQKKIIKKFLPVIAGFIILSPLPDELAIALLGSIKYELNKFILYSFVLHFFGILIISLVAKIA